jgi:spore coat protein U-like protein
MRYRAQVRAQVWAQVGALAASLGAVPALVAGPALGQFTHASVSCALSATPLNFGVYSPSWPMPTDFSATISVTCTTPLVGPVPVSGTLMLSPGSGASGARHMSHDGAVLRYQIYIDAGYRVQWGDGSGSGIGVPIAGTTGRDQPLRLSFTARGRLLARQGPAPAGAYNDFLSVTLNY